MKKICALLFMGIIALPLSAFALTVKSVDFMNVGGKSRIQLSLDGPAVYDVTRKGDNVELKISAARIVPSYARPLVTADFETAVKQITPRQSGSNVIVNISMKVMAPYFVSQDKNQLIMDIDIPASVKQIKATPKVVLRDNIKPKPKPMQPVDMTGTVVDGLDGTRYTGEPITLEFQNADIHALLRIIAEVSGLNIVTSDDVKGEVTIKLKNVPRDQALDVILEAKDLDKMQVGNVIRIAPAATIKATKERKLASIKTEEQLEPLLTSVIPVNFAKSSEIAKTIKGKEVGIVSERGSITADDRTNVLIVKDIKKNVDSIYAMIKKLDRATPQVLIQARIVQADDDFTRGLGIAWGGSYRNQSDRSHFGLSGLNSSTTTTNLFSTTSSGSSQPNWSTTVSPTPTMAVNLGQSQASGVGLTLGRLGGSLFQLDLRIDVGESTGQAKVIARPKVVTLDNKKATIRQGEKYPYLTRDSDGNVSTELKDIELVLDVTPRIAFDGSINMEINVKRNALGSTKNSLGDPSIASREVQTEVMVKDGETSVIGGIIEEETHNNVDKIPWLGDLPVIGYLFKGSTKTSSKKELLVFISPHVIDSANEVPQP